MSGWVHFADHVCGGRAGGTTVHAVAFFSRPPGSKRKTFDAACGQRVKLLGAPVEGQDGFATLIWPPYVDGAASIGMTRCSECYQATGRPKPQSEMGSVDWHKARKQDQTP